MTRIKSDQNLKLKIDIVFYGWVSFFGTYTAFYRSGQASLPNLDKVAWFCA